MPISGVQVNTELLDCQQVLSVETALSIQSHPDKSLAEQLHAKSPKVLPSRTISIRSHQSSNCNMLFWSALLHS